MKRVSLVIAIIAALGMAAGAAEPEPGEGAKPETIEKKVDVKNPIRAISAMMKKAGKLLEKLETGTPTQEEQKKILEELDRLIQMAEQASSSSSQSQQQRNKSSKSTSQPRNAGNTGSSPMTNESDVMRAVRTRLGAGAPDLKEMWGKLPEAERDEIMQLLSEKLPMRYKQLLYLYFKALSEKK